MALPVPDKTWQFNVNQIIPTQATALTTNRRVLRTIKNSLIGFGSSPWTVRGSSNSTTAAMDGVDRWTTDADLVGATAGSPHAWIVLRQVGVATNYELCLDVIGGINNTGMGRYISPSAGFTGGSTTARPTATDEISLPSSNAGWGTLPALVSYVVHVLQSTDGQATYMAICSSNLVTLIAGFGRIKNPVTGIPTPSYAFFECEMATNSGSTLDAADNSLFTTPLTAGPGATSTGMLLYLTSEGTNTDLLADTFIVPNDFNGEYPLFPIALASQTVSNRGRHGQVFDMWLGLSSLLTGDTYPNDTSRQFAHFGMYVVPWNGSIMVTS